MTSTPVPIGPSLEARVAPALVVPGAFRVAPWSAATARAWAQTVVGAGWLLAAGTALWVATLVSAALVPLLGLGLAGLTACLLVARAFGAAERARFAAQTAVVIPAPERRPAVGPVRGWRRACRALALLLRDGRAWAAVGYAVLGPLLAVTLLVLSTAVAGGAVGALIFPFVGQGSGLARDALPEVPWPLVALACLALAVVLLWASAAVVQWGTLLQVRLASALLGRSAASAARARADAAESEARTAHQRAAVLTETRSQAVAAADAERRRIERDLHDGAQQRLVALGVELGVARRLAERDPAASAAALEHAHGEIKATLAELRDLVRGIHPAVLSDRGLDAALSALAARSPVPVRVEASSDLSRAGSAAQAAAYFVVAEALTNVAKHADARSVQVRADVTDDGARLRVVVADDGRGGAEPSPGSGLAGLRGRVAALDGVFELDSPPGAGTRLTVEVPCAS
ncbi:histidine kinase [Isoptericola sp. 4D.3]|uniref:histidine kinase n=1 Tax=Isoptericola peretonis TaxID=2918523 RepID=A0ABT0J7A0_9MICO|nr:histidine kinase [Isoptericola sp. 4D.3]